MNARKFTRIHAGFRIFFSGESYEGEGTVTDLSREGCGVECETDIVMGTNLEIWLFMPDYDWPLKIEQAEVRWRVAEKFGLEFLVIRPSQRQRLRTMVRAFLEAQGSPPSNKNQTDFLLS